MGRGSNRLASRLLAVGVLAILVWLADLAGLAAVGGVHHSSAQAFQQELGNTRNPERQSYYRSAAEQRLDTARELVPTHPAYALQAVELIHDRRALTVNPAQRAELLELAAQITRSALAVAPVRAELWSRYTRLLLESGGASPDALYALERALILGPREYGPLLANASVTFNHQRGLSGEQRLAGWNAVLTALEIPTLSSPVWTMAKSAGMERQLRALVRQRERERDILQQRQQGAGRASNG